MKIKELIEKFVCRRLWDKHNPGTKTRIGKNRDKRIIDLIRLGKLTVGKYSYGSLNIDLIGCGDEALHIGSLCSISSQCTFLLSGEHNVKALSSYPFDAIFCGQNITPKSKGPIIIDDDVWIGDHALILSGVHIGQGAVVAAGCVVTKDVPPYAIVGGVPAKVIKYRFNDALIQELLKVDYSKLNDTLIKAHIPELYKELTKPEDLDWLPKKAAK